jgi:glycosyltransferase involved in cell wall biosynthesis
MDILFVLAGDETRASTRYRVLNLLPALTEAGIKYETASANKYEDVIPGPDSIGYGLFTFELLLRAPQHDVLFLQKVPLPAPVLKVLSKAYDKIIYDFDDALYAAPEWEDRESQWKSFLNQTLQHSSVVLTGNPVLSDYARQFTDTVVCLPTTLPAEAYRAKRNQGSHSDADTVTLGWIGNPQNLHYLASIEATLEEILNANDAVEFHIITAGDLPTTPLQNHPDVTYKTWTLEDELDLLEAVDIGLRPLFDDEWTRGKGGYTSVVQMMALGIPVVVSPVGMITDIVEHSYSGYHANLLEEWTRYISELIEDEQKRTSFGEHAYEAVEKQRFWTDQRAEEWVNVFADLNSE